MERFGVVKRRDALAGGVEAYRKVKKYKKHQVFFYFSKFDSYFFSLNFLDNIRIQNNSV